ncbi:MAG: galactonate dehydratase [Dehalococcoidales bacterium]|nr:galactonate dehydratase [Dehalococcoidales bacterium]
MKITEVKTFLVGVTRQSWLFVKIETDEGIYGWGEGSLEGQEKAVEAAVHNLSPRIIDQDPTQIERHWQVMYRHGFWRGGVVLNSALSAIDQALWDITGKVYDTPVYNLLGGRIRDKVRAYTHVFSVDQAEKIAAAGYTGMKAGGMFAPGAIDPYEASENMRVRIKEIREAIGPDIDIMIDNHGRAWPSLAIRQIRSVQEYNIYFFEEPVPPDNLDALAQVRRNISGIDLATGERLFSRWEYKQLIEQQLVDIIQPDVCHCGGISEFRRISSAAETYYIRVAPHNPNGPVATAASIQLSAAIPNFDILEYASSESSFTDNIVKQPILPEEGYFAIPDSPGLGIDLDETAIKRYPYKQKSYDGIFYTDGGVADV